MKLLNPKELKVAEGYILTANATQAGKEAGFSEKSAAVMANRVLKRPHVIAYIESRKAQLQDRTNTGIDNILSELSCIAFADIKKVLVSIKGDDLLDIKSLSEIDDKTAKAIAEISITPTRYGVVKKIKFYDKIAAIDKIAKLHGFYINIYELIEKLGEDKAHELFSEFARKHSVKNLNQKPE